MAMGAWLGCHRLKWAAVFRSGTFTNYRRDSLQSFVNLFRMERGLLIGAAMTAVLATATFALIPITGMVNSPTYNVILVWMTVMAVVVLCHSFVEIAKMGLRGQSRPLQSLWANIDRKQAAVVLAGSLLLGTNLVFFVNLKPQLGQIVAFSADPLLADIDNMLFFGVDPWRLTQWFNEDFRAVIYHRGWFLYLGFVAYFLLRMPASEEKDRLIVSYVALWTFFGPLVHLALPAAGPVFYDDLGLGNRFIELKQSARSQAVANYLWTGYTNKMFFPASGISAMPSLHLATMFWSLIALRNSRWLIAGVAFTIYIFLGSIGIGWHYAVDGIVGGIGAYLCYALVGMVLRRDSEQAVDSPPEIAVATVNAECSQAQTEAV